MTVAAVPQDAVGVETNYTKLLLGFLGMAIGQFMAILDIQIVAASLSQIQAGIGASADEIAWVQTSYLLAEVVIMPLTAYMTRLWGTQKTFLTCCTLFMGTSVLAGLSTSIEMMIVTRSLQGLTAGAMIPVVFAVAFTAFPVEKRMTANIAMGLIVTLAPTIGPTLGGHLTEALSWRWLFFVNVVPGALSLYLVARWGDFDKGDPSLKRGVDWWGLIAMTIALISIQLVLEEGAEHSWFADDGILWLTVLGVLTLGVFIWRQLTYWQPLINLRLFTDRNFSLGIAMNLVMGVSLYGGTFVLPLYLAQIRQYSAAEVGTTMLTSGLAMFAMAPVTRPLLRYINDRWAIFGGFVLTAYAMSLGAHLNDQWGFWEFAALQAIRGAGSIVAMAAAQQVTVSTLQPSQMKDASAMVNLARNVGGAVGLAAVSTILTVNSRMHLSTLSAAVSQASYESQQMLAMFTARMAERGLANPDAAARKAFQGLLTRDAAVMAFADAFMWLAIAAAFAAGLALLVKTQKARKPLDIGAH
jgi:MFS transporter, DHA2 family, multidrug resistance protein